MSEHEDLLASMKAEMDQAVAASGELAQLMGSYYRALGQEGIPPEHAALLCVSLQAIVFRPPPSE